MKKDDYQNDEFDLVGFVLVLVLVILTSEIAVVYTIDNTDRDYYYSKKVTTDEF